ERTIAASGTPEDIAAWRDAKRGYRITRAIDEDVNEATGEYNPQKLLGRIAKRFGSATAAGDVGDIAKAGQFIYKPDVPPAQQRSILAKHPAVAAGFGAGVGSAATGAAEHYGVSHLLDLAHDPAALALYGVGT